MRTFQIALLRTGTVRGICGLLVILTVLTGCGAASPSRPLPLAIASASTLGSGTVPARLQIEPLDGTRQFIRLIDRAQSTIYVEAYLLTDRTITRALQRASAQGVSVRVLLERRPFGVGTQPTTEARKLQAAGILVRWGRPGFTYTHAKFAVVDGRTTVIGTANYSRAAFHSNREILVYTTVPGMVAEAASIFISDWNRTPLRLSVPDIVVAPDDARRKLTTLIGSARHTIDVYAEEMADAELEATLIHAAERGVRVRVLLSPGASLVGAPVSLTAGISLRWLAWPYVHAKAIIVDRHRAFVGSENFSTTSLDENREVGVLIRGSSLRRLLAIFSSDWQRARSA